MREKCYDYVIIRKKCSVYWESDVTINGELCLLSSARRLLSALCGRFCDLTRIARCAASRLSTPFGWLFGWQFPFLLLRDIIRIGSACYWRRVRGLIKRTVIVFQLTRRRFALPSLLSSSVSALYWHFGLLIVCTTHNQDNWGEEWWQC